jgi:prepilin-type N-terminal cleavage/methylation domain-containing protein
MRHLYRLLRHDERGVSLLETSVALAITAIIAAALLAWTFTASSVDGRHAGDDEAVHSLRLVREQMLSELRSARSVLAAEPLSVTVWSDAARDAELDTGESITWTLSVGGEMLRSTDLDTGGPVASGFDASASYFGYDASLPGEVTTISVHLVATVPSGVGTADGVRSLEVDLRLRNL